MRIRTRLFLLIAMLVLALVGLQWWLGVRRIETTRHDMVTVATTVGHKLIAELGEPALAHVTASGSAEPVTVRRVAVVPREGEPASGATPPPHGVVVLSTVVQGGEPARPGEAGTPPACAIGTVVTEDVYGRTAAQGGGATVVQRIDLDVTGTGDADRVLVVRGPDGERRIPIPVAAPASRARADLRRGLLLSGALLGAGLLAAAFIAHRVTSPLRQLASGVEAVGRGTFQTRVAVTGSGEIGELQRGFNAMAEHLAAIEAEREAWRDREHLAQLGDLARGLAHTLRNPLNTLGLAVEELAGRSGADEARLVDTARAQIRRVDRWLLSFLALGAGRGIDPEPVDLAALAGDVVLEAVQTGADVALEAPPEPVVASIVPQALRAALANLVENAVQASPPGFAVTVGVSREGGAAVVRVGDRGPGLPEEVRRRLFDPHVTTRVGGAGMGLFLAKQLVEAGLGGRLEIGDREGGGTEAVVTLAAGDQSGAGLVS